MKRRILVFAVAALAALTVTGVALAAVNFHNVVFNDNGTTLTVSGKLSGLGNGDVLVTVSASAIPTATCTNKGGNQAPGQNPATVDVTGASSIPAAEIKNGQTPFSVTTSEPATPSATDAGCPNGKWTAEITDLLFTSFTVTVSQGGVVVGTYTGP
jgi:hypothetical protein